jgi:hypothetical protein
MPMHECGKSIFVLPGYEALQELLVRRGRGLLPSRPLPKVMNDRVAARACHDKGSCADRDWYLISLVSAEADVCPTILRVREKAGCT